MINEKKMTFLYRHQLQDFLNKLKDARSLNSKNLSDFNSKVQAKFLEKTKNIYYTVFYWNSHLIFNSIHINRLLQLNCLINKFDDIFAILRYQELLLELQKFEEILDYNLKIDINFENYQQIIKELEIMIGKIEAYLEHENNLKNYEHKCKIMLEEIDVIFEKLLNNLICIV